MCKIKAIIFDLGGVILKNTAEAVYEELARALSINFRDLKKLQNKYKDQMSKGEVSAQEFADTTKNNFNLQENVLLKWKEAYLKVMPINRELIGLVEKLKLKYQVGIISNVPELHAQINKERGIFSRFNPALISCEIGLIKPQKEIFDLALKLMKLKAEECIFIDDRTKHLEVPKNMGFKIIHYKNNGQLIKELKELI